MSPCCRARPMVFALASCAARMGARAPAPNAATVWISRTYRSQAGEGQPVCPPRAPSRCLPHTPAPQGPRAVPCIPRGIGRSGRPLGRPLLLWAGWHQAPLCAVTRTPPGVQCLLALMRNVRVHRAMAGREGRRGVALTPNEPMQGPVARAYYSRCPPIFSLVRRRVPVIDPVVVPDDAVDSRVDPIRKNHGGGRLCLL